MTKLAGKIAVVTGGSAGIGRGIASHFVREGARVFITGRNQAELDKVVTSASRSTEGGEAGSAIPQCTIRIAAFRLKKRFVSLRRAGFHGGRACFDEI